MTYEESYMKCSSLKELEKEVNTDIVLANMINPARLKKIKEAAEKVANMKFKQEEI